MFAQTFLQNSALSEWVLLGIRIVATLVGAFAGWFLFDPLTRLGYRILVRAATPGWLLPWTKLAGAATIATLTYVFLPLGFGNGLGPGFGPGGGPGPGPGPGPDNAVAKNGKPPAKNDKVPSVVKAEPRKPAAIEILGGDKYNNDDRYYLKEKKAFSYDELKDYLAENKTKIELKIVVTDESASFGNADDDPRRRLQKLADDLGIPHRLEQPKQ